MKFFICQFSKCLHYYDTADRLNEHYIMDHDAVMPNMGQAIIRRMYMDYSEMSCPCGSTFIDNANNSDELALWSSIHRPHSNGFCRVLYDPKDSIRTFGKMMKEQTYKF